MTTLNQEKYVVNLKYQEEQARKLLQSNNTATKSEIRLSLSIEPVFVSQRIHRSSER